MPKRFLKPALFVLLFFSVIAALRSVVIVDQTESVLITAFGRPVRLIEQPGLSFKWPHESVRSFDRRLQLDRPPPREMLTKDKKNLDVAWYASWRIADVETFLRTARTLDDASARLEDIAASVLAAELGSRELGALVGVGDRSLLDTMMIAVKGRIAEQALREYGVKVADVRLVRLNYPEEVRAAVFEQIKSERQRVAAATRAEGESQSRVIRSAAERDRALLIAEAEADAARIIGEGEAEAARIANQAHGADPAFYRFQKTLEAYRAALDARTTLILSADSNFLRLLSQGVGEPARTKPVKPSPAPSAGASDPVVVREKKNP
jgi:membrane protease subunit HflC